MDLVGSKIKTNLGWGHSSVVEHLPTLYEAHGSIFSTGKKNKQTNKGRSIIVLLYKTVILEWEYSGCDKKFVKAISLAGVSKL